MGTHGFHDERLNKAWSRFEAPCSSNPEQRPAENVSYDMGSSLKPYMIDPAFQHVVFDEPEQPSRK